MTAQTSTYAEILRAFQTRLGELEREGTDLDELAAKLDEGFALLESLKTKLTETEARIEEVIRVRHGE
jgi:exodeoxyribonuclease VII small subunit